MFPGRSQVLLSNEFCCPQLPSISGHCCCPSYGSETQMKRSPQWPSMQWFQTVLWFLGALMGPAAREREIKQERWSHVPFYFGQDKSVCILFVLIFILGFEAGDAWEALILSLQRRNLEEKWPFKRPESEKTLTRAWVFSLWATVGATVPTSSSEMHVCGCLGLSKLTEGVPDVFTPGEGVEGPGRAAVGGFLAHRLRWH